VTASYPSGSISVMINKNYNNCPVSVERMCYIDPEYSVGMRGNPSREQSAPLGSEGSTLPRTGSS